MSTEYGWCSSIRTLRVGCIRCSLHFSVVMPMRKMVVTYHLFATLSLPLPFHELRHDAVMFHAGISESNIRKEAIWRQTQSVNCESWRISVYRNTVQVQYGLQYRVRMSQAIGVRIGEWWSRAKLLNVSWSKSMFVFPSGWMGSEPTTQMQNPTWLMPNGKRVNQKGKMGKMGKMGKKEKRKKGKKNGWSTSVYKHNQFDLNDSQSLLIRISNPVAAARYIGLVMTRTWFAAVCWS